METDRIMSVETVSSRVVIRFYTWKRHTISFGYNQNPFRRIDIERCLEDGLELVARPTGGREILHGEDLCCSVVWPLEAPVSAIDARGILSFVNTILQKGLGLMNIDSDIHEVSSVKSRNSGPCFSQIDRGEVSAGGRKIIASAQRVFPKAVLQQTSIQIYRPGRDIYDYLRRNDTKAYDVNRDLKTGYLEDFLGETLTLGSIVDRFREAFETGFVSGIIKK